MTMANMMGVILALFLSLLALSVPVTADPLAYVCYGGNYTANSSFQSNLDLLLSSLPSTNSTFLTDAVGPAPDRAYGLALCRGDAVPADCAACLNNAAQDLRSLCPTSKQATVWYDNCELRYSDLSFYSIVYEEHYQILIWPVNATDVDSFVDLEAKLLDAVSRYAANSSMKFATGAAPYGNGSRRMYALAQCTRDLSAAGCSRCLNQIRGYYKLYEMKIAGRVLGQSCTVRYELNQFFVGEPTLLLDRLSASPPHPPSPVPQSASDTGKGKTGINDMKIKIGLVSGLGGLLLACALFVMYLRRYSEYCNSVTFWNKDNNDQIIEDFIVKYGNMGPKRYTYSDLKRITKSFHDKLGQGGYGTVYKGTLANGREVAVKVLSESKGNGEEFLNEVSSIAMTSHVNIVSLLGFCYERSKRALIYDFMCNGSLEKFVYSEKPRTPPEWERLYKITVGIARGLEYLHRGCSTRIVHFDIKPHNILLDHDFCPKISDFGLAQLCLSKGSIISMAGLRGTIGYIAPEVFSRSFGVVSSKSDVYSYGMMVLEMVAGRKNATTDDDCSSETYFPHWIYEHLKHGGDMQTCGVTAETEESARKMTIVGLWCIQTKPRDRPTITEVIQMLEGNINDLDVPPKPYLSTPLQSLIGTSSIHDGCRADDRSSDHESSIL